MRLNVPSRESDKEGGNSRRMERLIHIIPTEPTVPAGREV